MKNVTLVDVSGQINAKVWDIAEVLLMGEHPKKGDIVKVDAVAQDYKGSLQLKVNTMLFAAEKLTTAYPCNMDLLYAGIILHDIGKVYELTTDETGLSTEYTLEGELLGHIAIGLRIIEHMEGFDVEKKLLLQHMTLSHHQTSEWGSLKRPMLKEAKLLHHLDMIDSRMFD